MLNQNVPPLRVGVCLVYDWWNVVQRCVNVPWGGNEVDPILHQVQLQSQGIDRSGTLGTHEVKAQSSQKTEDLPGVADEYHKPLTHIHLFGWSLRTWN